MMETEPELLSLKVAARKLGISETFAREMVRQESFPARVVRLGRRRLVSRADLDRFLASLVANGVQTASEPSHAPPDEVRAGCV